MTNTEIGSLTINDIRAAFQTQMIKEADARYGTRYKEILLGHYGVLAQDSRLQIPEFLGKVSCPIDITQVTQMSSTDNTSPQGNVSAFSLSAMSKKLFTKSFVEHGYVIICAGVRLPHRTYCQGLPKHFSRLSRYDFFWPDSQHLGDQPVLNKEIFATGYEGDDEVFGYQEIYADYRYMPNMATGYMRTNVENSLAV